MKFALVTNACSKVAQIARKGRFMAIDKAPELYFVGATIMGLGAIVATYSATLKFQEVLEEHNKLLEEQEKVVEKVESGEIVTTYTDADKKADRKAIYIKSAVKVVRVWAPVALLGISSLLMFGKSFGLLKGRYISMAAAYAGVLKEKLALEDRIKEEYGEEALKKVTSPKETKIVNDDGTEYISITEETADNWAYAKFFDESNVYWEKNPEHNRFFLHGKEAWANKKLKRDGHLFLNDVYTMLGIPATKAGQVMGWVYYEDPEEAKRNGSDNHVSFGLFNNTIAGRDFINGYENSFLLRFNVDPKPVLGRNGWALA